MFSNEIMTDIYLFFIYFYLFIFGNSVHILDFEIFHITNVNPSFQSTIDRKKISDGGHISTSKMWSIERQPQYISVVVVFSILSRL